MKKDKKQLVLIVFVIVILLLSFTVGGAGKYAMDYISYGSEDMVGVSEVNPEAESEVEPVVGDNNSNVESVSTYIEYRFRNAKLKNQHYEKHGIEMGFDSADKYEIAASDVANSREALHKLEAEDGDDVYYIERTNEFVIVSKDGYLRTYFNPSRGIDYYNRQ